jgi:hypothetical protein
MLFSGTIEKMIVEQPDALPVLKLHYLRWFRALIYDLQVGICLRTSKDPRPPASPRLDSSKAGRRVLQELVARRRLGGKQPSHATPSRC